MITYLNGPNGMYPMLDHIADQTMDHSRRETSWRWSRRYTGISKRAGRQKSRRVVLFTVSLVLIAMLFILAWV